jgi:hypothetical protein
MADFREMTGCFECVSRPWIGRRPWHFIFAEWSWTCRLRCRARPSEARSLWRGRAVLPEGRRHRPAVRQGATFAYCQIKSGQAGSVLLASVRLIRKNRHQHNPHRNRPALLFGGGGGYQGYSRRSAAGLGRRACLSAVERRKPATRDVLGDRCDRGSGRLL